MSRSSPARTSSILGSSTSALVAGVTGARFGGAVSVERAGAHGGSDSLGRCTGDRGVVGRLGAAWPGPRGRGCTGLSRITDGQDPVGGEHDEHGRTRQGGLHDADELSELLRVAAGKVYGGDERVERGKRRRGGVGVHAGGPVCDYGPFACAVLRRAPPGPASARGAAD